MARQGKSLAEKKMFSRTEKDAEQSPAEINFLWLRRLRWAILSAQVALVAVVHQGMGIQLPLLWLWSVLWGSFCSNAALQFWQKPPRSWLVGLMGGTLALDLLGLTLLLSWTGGPTNPFSFFYLVYVALAILILPQRWGWSLSGGAVLGYAALFWGWEGSQAHHSIHSPHQMKLHLEGMWLAYAITTVCIVWFVSRTKLALNAQAAKIRALQSLQARNEKLAAIAALAGGAMHEMATPLSTIALVAKELQRSLSHHQDLLQEGIETAQTKPSKSSEGLSLGPLIEDTALIRDQVELCHRILRELVHQAGESLGEAHATITLGELLEEARKDLGGSVRVDLVIERGLRQRKIHVPIQSLTRVIRGLLRNALEASAANARVVLSAQSEEQRLLIKVVDHGMGMRPEVAAQAGEPFFTTKPTGQGHGLGLFLAHTVAEHLGGELLVETALGQGTTVTLRIFV